MIHTTMNHLLGITSENIYAWKNTHMETHKANPMLISKISSTKCIW